ncbi:hypothetical protein [Mesorhizobium sp. B4-1-3]|uniref:hypothetical protein n=1 Tax=Mesorhizobium sp. B4-1-3 TaxID=2589889 RepID=UPI001FEFE0CC|nr:hypothetical protein [Mesorhizobium sp. B4-1-3]
MIGTNCFRAAIDDCPTSSRCHAISAPPNDGQSAPLSQSSDVCLPYLVISCSSRSMPAWPSSWPDPDQRRGRRHTLSGAASAGVASPPLTPMPHPFFQGMFAGGHEKTAALAAEYRAMAADGAVLADQGNHEPGNS